MPSPTIIIGFGLLIVVAGGAVFATAWSAKWAENRKRRRGKLVEGGIAVSVGMLFVMCGAFADDVKLRFSRTLQDVRTPDVESLAAIELAPDPRGELYQDLLEESIRIEDRQTIVTVTDMLRDAQRWAPNHPNGQWYCLLTLDFGDHTTSVIVSRTSNNGDLISVMSEVTHGFNLGDFRADGLAELLERLARASSNQ